METLCAPHSLGQKNRPFKVESLPCLVLFDFSVIAKSLSLAKARHDPRAAPVPTLPARSFGDRTITGAIYLACGNGCVVSLPLRVSPLVTSKCPARAMQMI